MSDTVWVSFDQVTKRYGSTWANRDITVSFAPGQIVGILGPNGAGKTTLLRQLVGLTRPTSGTIRVFDRPVRPGRRWLKNLIAYLPQHPLALGDLTVEEAILTSARLRGHPLADAQQQTRTLLEDLDLADIRTRLVGSLSGGEHRLAGIASALAAPTPIMALDEPTNELDPLMRRRVWDLIQALKSPDRLILLVSHNILEAERVLDRVVILHQGTVHYDGSPAALRYDAGDVLTVTITVSNPALDVIRDLADHHLVWERQNHTYSFTAPRPVALDLLAHWLRQSGHIASVTVNEPTLEDAYLVLRQKWAPESSSEGRNRP
ncbi:MAG: ABC transporter ATP-binding protein [Sulfobacillus sp.]|nr:ABC transporter ATP-binding protein [Sulfobacillus sp.]